MRTFGRSVNLNGTNFNTAARIVHAAHPSMDWTWPCFMPCLPSVRKKSDIEA